MLVTNFPFSGGQRSGNFFVAADKQEKIVEEKDFLGIFRGYLYPDVPCSVPDVFGFLHQNRAGIFSQNSTCQQFSKFKGRYCGVYIQKTSGKVCIFNDQLGLQDIFFWQKNGKLMISDRFVRFFEVCNFSEAELDQVALAEFFLYEHPLRDRTFLKNGKVLPYATIQQMDANTQECVRSQYWQYRFAENVDFSKQQAMQKFHKLLQKAMWRIQKLHPKNNFALGLSGGLDSRLVAQYAQEAGLTIHPFLFSNKNSDAFVIARETSDFLGWQTHEHEIPENYWEWSAQHTAYDPMINSMYTAYGAVRDQLPSTGALLTGFNGDNLFGSHLRAAEKTSIGNASMHIKKRYEIAAAEDFFPAEIVRHIDEDISAYDHMKDVKYDWQKAEIFNFENRQLRFIKNNPSFHFYGKFRADFSPFADIDVVEYVLTFPLDELFQQKFYVDFYQRYLPELARIRPERKAYLLTDSAWMKHAKTFLLKVQFKIQKELGIRIPFFPSISFLEALNWKELFGYINFDEMYQDIPLPLLQQIRTFPNTVRNVRLKYHALTLQKFFAFLRQNDQ